MEYPPKRYAIIVLMALLLALLALPGNAASLQASPTDTTPPTITYTRTPAPNEYGWNNGPVTVRFVAADASGLRTSTTYTKIFGAEGPDQSVTWSATDTAGNTRTVTVGGISIDWSAPGVIDTWPSRGDTDIPLDLPLTITFDDDVDPASVAGITLWDGNRQVAATATGDASDMVTLDHGVLMPDETYTVIVDGATDLAGNPMDRPYSWTFTTDPTAVVPDTTPPVITYARTPAANANGWNNGPVTVVFTATDLETGLATAGTYTKVFSTDGAGQSFTWSATDNAGNTRTVTVGDVNIDRIAPTIAGAPTTAANGNGWYKDSVVVHFTASDSGSGVATVTPDLTLTAEGAAQSATGTATDRAGNTASVTVGGINIDRTAPKVASTTPASGASGVGTGAAVSATFSEKVDPASAIAGVTLWDGSTKLSGTVTYDSANNVATLAHAALSAGKTYTVKVAGVTDLAGNVMSATYAWSFSVATPTPSPSPTVAPTTRPTVRPTASPSPTATPKPAPAPLRDAAIISCSVPTPVIAGQCYAIKVTVKNTGTVTWPLCAGYALAPLGDACLFDKKATPLYCWPALKPGQQHTFCICVRAPARAGLYHLQYQMSYRGTPFGNVLTKDVQVTAKKPDPKCTPGPKCGTASPRPQPRQCQV